MSFLGKVALASTELIRDESTCREKSNIFIIWGTETRGNSANGSPLEQKVLIIREQKVSKGGLIIAGGNTNDDKTCGNNALRLRANSNRITEESERRRQDYRAEET
ncbi:hypothetical protein LOAG_12312 [Loa loa]|uniref:Uncharacterized protein n=1 Tax=Loa loa TaxID=7209 RepID=A0A1S0TLF5_LOALO|nr:hypothetical protein LOAG_12312 [Loa loa]EFO16195.1 hypothetical protein LOAG_12312 [Loa loa]